jgi:choline dehydrogenase-like flavoprotein
VLAARLSEDPERSVCLVEAGPTTGRMPRNAGRRTCLEEEVERERDRDHDREDDADRRRDAADQERRSP